MLETVIFTCTPLIGRWRVHVPEPETSWRFDRDIQTPFVSFVDSSTRQSSGSQHQLPVAATLLIAVKSTQWLEALFGSWFSGYGEKGVATVAGSSCSHCVCRGESAGCSASLLLCVQPRTSAQAMVPLTSGNTSRGGYSLDYGTKTAIF